ncbi:MAG TPA: hypothetical protein VF487_00205 [Chitinophagaceae bacterium]
MNQKEFTNYIIPKIIDRFPQFKDLCTIKPNDIIDIDYKSNQGKLTFWLTTQDKEVTLGFTGDTDCDWHTHMSLFGANTPDEELEVVVDFIDKVINDKKLIVHSSIQGYYPTDDTIDEITKEQEQGETLEVFKWSDL